MEQHPNKSTNAYLLGFLQFPAPNLPKHLLNQSLLIGNVQVVQPQTLIMRRIRIQSLNDLTHALEHDRVPRPDLVQRVLPADGTIGKVQHLVVLLGGAEFQPIDDELALSDQAFALEKVQYAQFFACTEVLRNFCVGVFVGQRRKAILVQDVQ